jgi:hypothetical protein
VRDLQQPRELGIRADAALQCAMRIEERRLDGVLRLLARAQPAEAESEDLARVTLEQRPGPGPIYGFDGGNFDPRRKTFDPAVRV